jgi:hypothetical protein
VWLGGQQLCVAGWAGWVVTEFFSQVNREGGVLLLCGWKWRGECTPAS